MTSLAILGAPTSAAAYSPGMEKAPRALREAGLVTTLEYAGIRVIDRGDLPAFRWRPDLGNRYAQNLDAVVDSVRRTQTSVQEILRLGDMPLVVGGSCSLTLGTVAGFLGQFQKVGLIYMDLHPDLNLPSTTMHGTLGWMGMAHMLGLEGSLPELSRIGPRYPLLQPWEVYFCGVEGNESTAWENDTLRRKSLRFATAAELARHPEGVAADILESWSKPFERLIIHFDVDVLDFFDTPLAENYSRNCGVTLEQAMAALGVFAAHEKFGGLVITEINPDHADEEGSTLKRFVAALANALTKSKHLRGGRQTRMQQ